MRFHHSGNSTLCTGHECVENVLVPNPHKLRPLYIYRAFYQLAWNIPIQGPFWNSLQLSRIVFDKSRHSFHLFNFFFKLSPAWLWKLIFRGIVGRVSGVPLSTKFTLFTSDRDWIQDILLKGLELLTTQTNSCWHTFFKYLQI